MEFKQAVFDAPYGEILGVFASYYSKYGTVPTKGIYDDYKTTVHEYAKYVQTFCITEDEERKLRTIENKLYRPVAEEDYNYIKDNIKEYLLMNYHRVSQQKASILIEDPTLDTDEAFVQSMREHQRWYTRLTNALNNNDDTGKYRYAVGGKIDTEVTNTRVPMRTLFKAIWFSFMGLTTMISAAKSYKTGITIALAIWLVKQGFHVLMFDLENGMGSYLKRIYQSILNLPEECIFSDTGVDRSKIAGEYDEYSRLGNYKVGQKVYIICSERELKDGKAYSFDSDDYEYYIEVRYFKCTDKDYQPLTRSTQIQNYKGWEEIDEETIEEFEPDNVYVNFTEFGQKKMNAIQKKSGGMLLVADLPNVAVEHMAEVIEDLSTNPFVIDDEYREEQADFFKIPAKRFVLIDWITLIQSTKNFKGIFELTDYVYMTLKDIMNNHQCTMFVVEGTNDVGAAELQKWEPNKNAVQPRGTRKASFDVVHKCMLRNTKNEQRELLRTLIAMDSRLASVNLATDYMLIDPDTQQVEIITPEQHQKLNPEDWKADRNVTKKPKNPKKELTSITEEDLGTALNV